MRQEIQQQLFAYAEEEYRAFQEKLLPGVAHMMGVRLPKLRAIAKQTAKKDALLYLTQMQAIDWQTAYYEEKMLYGLVIGYAKMNDNQYKEWLDTFVPIIDNWGVCDSCCMTYKWMRKQPDYWWDCLNSYLAADTEFSVRFGLVAMLDHFIEEAYIHKLFSVCNQLRNDSYYAKMAAAWLISMCFVKFPKETYLFLQSDQMDCFTHNKSIQKTCESYRVAKEWKPLLRDLRR